MKLNKIALLRSKKMNDKLAKRRFKLWDYNVSHNQLLIRSSKSENTNTNIDIKFIGVSYINLPATITDISFVEPISEELNIVN
jgi:hypothetical protein